MSMDFADLQTASRMRDLIEGIATKVVDKKRPEPRIGSVDHVDQERQLAWIKYPGEDVLIKVRIARNMLPTHTIREHGFDRADVVRVAGKPGGYYVVSFIRGDPADPKRDAIGQELENTKEDLEGVREEVDTKIGDVLDTVDTKLGEILPAIEDALEEMDSQQEFIQTRNSTFRQPTEPVGTPGAPLRIGDSWYKTSDGYKLHHYTASGWVVSTTSHVLTPNGKMGIEPNGLWATDQNGQLTFFLNAATGAMMLRGSLNAGLDISGATVTGGTVQTDSALNRGVKMANSGLAAYHPTTGQPVLQFLSSTGELSILGNLRAGSTITGANILAVDANNKVTFSVNGATGLVEMTGNIRAGSTISGANILAVDQNNNITFWVNGTTGQVDIRGTFTSGSPSGPRVTLSTAVWNNQSWGMLQFHTAQPGWNPGQVWSVYEYNTGVMRISSPYASGQSWDRSASLSLGTDINGSDYASIDAAAVYMNGSNYYLGSNGTSIDFRLQGTQLFQIIGNGRFNFTTENGGNFATISAWTGTTGAVRKPIQILAGGQMVFSLSSARNITYQAAFNYDQAAQLIDSTSDVALTFKYRTAANGSGFIDITDWSGDAARDLRGGTISAFTFSPRSDITLKRDFEPISGALPLLMSDEAMVYEYNLYDRDPDKAVYALAEPVRHLGKRRGVIANHLLNVLPELVDGEEGSYTIDLYGLVGMVLTALREHVTITDERLNGIVEQLADLQGV